MLGDGIRRDIATISDEERTLFINAIRKLDDPASAFVYGNNAGHEGVDPAGSANITYWDMQEQIHKDAHANGQDVHGGPAFIPWHRALVNHFEELLRQVDPRLSLHYWDWTTDPRVATADRAAILTGTATGSPQGLMGSSNGNAGAPLSDFESTEITGDPLNGIPGDGVHDHIWRSMPAGPSPVASDSSILGSLNFTAFASALQGAHNSAHGYIGGTLNNQHFSFHDPMVFLLHSNMDRLWATWQRATGDLERLDPTVDLATGTAKAYGTILADRGKISSYFDELVLPWAGDNLLPAPNHEITGLEPWKSDVSKRIVVSYRDPSIIFPPSYDTAVHASYIIVNRDTFSDSEVIAKGTFPVTFSNVFSVVYDGFTPKELGATTTPLPSPPPNLPTFAFTGANAVNAISPTASYEDPSGALDIPQRIMISYDLSFTSAGDFPVAAGGESFVKMQASLGYDVDTGTGGTAVPETAIASTQLVLVRQPDPYMVDTEHGDPSPYWLSVDTRVFQVKQGDTRGAGPAGPNGPATQGDMDSDSTAPYEFIQQVIANFNSLPNDSSHPFLTQLSEDETASQLELSQKVGAPPGQRVYNYAVAKVRYLAPNGVPATDVSAFFRIFSTAVSALDYDSTSGTTGNFRRTGNSNASSVPLLGIENDSVGQPETASIPFFSSPRVDTSIKKMTDQPPDNVSLLPSATFPHTNIQTIAGTGSENVAYFGAWIDVNLAPGDPNFRRLPLGQAGVSGWPDGPYSGTLQSLQQLMLGTHHCMVAEIFFWPPGTPGDPIPLDASPASSDRLAQRNLVLVKSGNPGYPATHTVQHTFIVKPSVLPGAGGGRRGANVGVASVVDARYRGPDELIVRWNNVPRTAQATFYMPEIDVGEIVALSALRQHPAVLEKVDAHTLQCRLSDVTFIPLPSYKGTIAGLLTVTLPKGVRTGQVFSFSVEQYSGVTLKTLGAFQMTIPVRPDPEILPDEIRKLSVMRYIQQGIPAGSRWTGIFVRYIDQIAARVRGFGGDPNAVLPSPDGGYALLTQPYGEGERHEKHRKRCRLKIPWFGLTITFEWRSRRDRD
jgi:tyrosinase-like protein